MPSKSWDQMNDKERLNWLRAQVEYLQQLVGTAADHNATNRAIQNLDAKIERVAKDVAGLKKHIEG
jgi:hypothetical protein